MRTFVCLVVSGMLALGWPSIAASEEPNARPGINERFESPDPYHHFEYPQAMLASLHRALRPGGRLVVVDFEKIEGTSRKWVLEHVRAGRQEVSAEIVRAGFTMDQQMRVDGMTENYMLQFRRP